MMWRYIFRGLRLIPLPVSEALLNVEWIYRRRALRRLLFVAATRKPSKEAMDWAKSEVIRLGLDKNPPPLVKTRPFSDFRREIMKAKGISK